MRVYIGPHVKWIGPYQIAEMILFWKDKDAVNVDDPMEAHPDHEYIHNFGRWLAEDCHGQESWLTRICSWIYNRRKRKVKVHVDGYDAWNADHTLAMVIVPVLKMVRESNGGAPSVDDEDVPEHLRSTSAPELTEEQKNTGHTDDNWFKRWEYVLDEMIWAFEQHADEDFESKFYSGAIDYQIIDGRLVNGPDHTFKVDYEGMDAALKRMTNGRRLFAKYYNSLWT